MISVVFLVSLAVPAVAIDEYTLTNDTDSLTFDYNNLQRQEQTIVVDGQEYTIVLGEAKKAPTPRLDYVLDEGQGSWSRDIYGYGVVLNLQYRVYYTIGSDNKVTIDYLSDEFLSGAFISVISEELTVVREKETTSSSAYCYYKAKVTLEVQMPLLTETVTLACNFKSGKLTVSFPF